MSASTPTSKKRGRDVETRGLSPGAVKAFFHQPEYMPLIREAHTRLEYTYCNDEETRETLLRAIADSTNMPLGRYMAAAVSDKYRHVYDPTQTTANDLPLFSFDGIRWTDRGISTVCEMDEDAYKVTRNVALTLIQLLGGDAAAAEEEEDEEEDEDGDDGGGSMPTVVQMRAHLERFVRRVDGGLLRSARGDMHAIMKSSGFYTAKEKPTPAEFFKLLDYNPDLVGYANGVVNFREPDGAFKFYAKGAVPAHFVVSYNTHTVYDGPAIWSPRDSPADSPFDYPGLTEEQRAGMKEVEDATIRRFFFEPEMYTAATRSIGCLYFGGNPVKKLLLLLGAAGNNGKSALVTLIGKVFGEYKDSLDKTALTENARARTDPSAANPAWCKVYKKRVVFIFETTKKDTLDSSNAKLATGGDPMALRALYGRPFNAIIFPMICWVSNVAPNYDGNDIPLKGRLYPVACDASFVSGTVDEVPERGVWKSMPSPDFNKYIDSHISFLTLLFIGYARQFADAGYMLPPVPESAAKTAVADGASGHEFEAWFSDNYEPTTVTTTGRIDWAKHGPAGAIKLSVVLSQYAEETGEKALEVSGAKAVLKRLGYAVSSIKNPAHEINYNDGVKAARKETIAAGAAEDDVA